MIADVVAEVGVLVVIVVAAMIVAALVVVIVEDEVFVVEVDVVVVVISAHSVLTNTLRKLFTAGALWPIRYCASFRDKEIPKSSI